MRVLVTGGAGFIGGRVVRALLGRGHEVHVLDNLSTGHVRNVASGASFEEVDMRDRSRVHASVRGIRPDVVCHQAAQTSIDVSTRDPVGDAQTNIVGSLHLLDACVRYDVSRVVFASTGGAIYGEVPEGQRADASWAPKPASPYACAKLAVEQYLQSYRHLHGLASTVLRYANVYGPGQDPDGTSGVVAIFAKRLLAGQSIRIHAMRELGDGGCVRDYVFVDDVVAANVTAVEGSLQGTVNIGTGVATTTRQIADGLIASLDIAGQVRVGMPRRGDLERSVLAVDPRVAPCTSLAQGLRVTAAYFAG